MIESPTEILIELDLHLRSAQLLKEAGKDPVCSNREALLATSPSHAYYYAYEILEGRFWAGEPVIATSPYYSYMYADQVIRGRFEAGESSIAQDPYYAFIYAVNVLKQRFHRAEVRIMESSYQFWYERVFFATSIDWQKEGF